MSCEKVSEIYNSLIQPNSEKEFIKQIQLLNNPISAPIILNHFKSQWSTYKSLINKTKKLCTHIKKEKTHPIVQDFICKITIPKTPEQLLKSLQNLAKDPELYKKTRLFFLVLSNKCELLTS